MDENKLGVAQNNQDIEKTIDELTLLDDDLMSLVFDQNIEATQLLLRIILEDDSIEVISSKGQVEYKSVLVDGRTITIDIEAVDGTGRKFDVEVQRNSEGSHIRRARFHSSMVDSRMLKENEKFKNLLDSYVIFICEHDKFRKKLPIYHVDRVVRETGQKFEDGSHIIYVNGKYKGDDPIGLLMHDFRCKQSRNIHYRELAEGVKHFKETREGRSIMCNAFEKLADERARLAAKEAAEKVKKENFLNMINDGMEKEQAQKYAGLSDELVEEALESLLVTSTDN